MGPQGGPEMGRGVGQRESMDVGGHQEISEPPTSQPHAAAVSPLSHLPSPRSSQGLAPAPGEPWNRAWVQDWKPGPAPDPRDVDFSDASRPQEG